MNLTPSFIRRRFAHRSNLLKIIDNMGWLVFDKVLRMGIGLAVGVWVARYLGPGQFGQIGFATAFIGLFGAIAGLGLQGIVVRDIVRSPACKGETLGTAVVLQLGGGLLAYGLILATIFVLRPEDKVAKLLVAILGATMLFKASDVAVYWFESQVQSKYTVWVQDASLAFFAAVKVMFILNSAPMIAFVWVTLAEALVVALLMLVMLGLHGPRLRELRITMARGKTLLADSWPLFLSSVAIVIYMKIDQIMLGQMLGDEAVGIYSAAVRISEAWYVIPMMIVTSVFPAITEAKKRSEALYSQRMQHLYDLLVLLSIGVALPMTFLSTPIVTLLFGEKYAESGAVLAVHIWATIFVSLGVSSGKWLIIEGLQLLALKRNVYGAALNILLNYFLIPAYHAIGAAIASLLAYVLSYYLMDAFDARTRFMFNQKTRSILAVFRLYKRNVRAK